MWLEKNKPRQIVGGEVREVSGGGRLCKIYKAMVRTLAFIFKWDGSQVVIRAGM